MSPVASQRQRKRARKKEKKKERRKEREKEREPLQQEVSVAEPWGPCRAPWAASMIAPFLKTHRADNWIGSLFLVERVEPVGPITRASAGPAGSGLSAFHVFFPVVCLSVPPARCLQTGTARTLRVRELLHSSTLGFIAVNPGGMKRSLPHSSRWAERRSTVVYGTSGSYCRSLWDR